MNMTPKELATWKASTKPMTLAEWKRSTHQQQTQHVTLLQRLNSLEETK